MEEPNDQIRAIFGDRIAAEFPPRRAVRLRPQVTGPNDPRSSKIGGLPWWPADEPWPQVGGESCVLLAQLAKDDFPEICFPNHADLLQVFWAPRFPDYSTGCLTPDPIIFWRRLGDSECLASAPEPGGPDAGLVPAPCSLSPERIDDLPSRSELISHLSPASISLLLDREHFEFCAPGSKVGGYAHWLQEPEPQSCPCGREMALLLTLASWEFQKNSRWVYPDPHRGGNVWYTIGRISGLEIGDSGSLFLFYCAHCRERPFVAVSQSL